MSLDRTYKIEDPPETAVPWKEYEHFIKLEWDRLLNCEPLPTEQMVQNFLEIHPSMVPGAFGLIGNESGHYPMGNGVISQAPLPSYNRRIPDFMWLSQSSDTEQPVLVEIESPSKKWFTRTGQQTKDFTQALNQIAEWKAWFSVNHNVQAFKEFYGLDRLAYYKRRFKPAYLLIYGRRAEANADPALTQKRTYLFPEDVIGMTFDRLQPNPKAEELVCLKAEGAGAFRVVSVPLTLEWNPGLEKERAQIRGWESAIEANPNITKLRKDFLIRRRAYWDEWSQREARGVINCRDRE